MKESKEFLCLSTHLDISSPHYKGSVTYRFCPRETSHGRSSGDPPPPLETSRTFFDSPEAFEALFIVQALIVRSLSGKNWQDRDKADKASISFPATPNDKFKCFWGCNEDIRKIYHPGG